MSLWGDLSTLGKEQISFPVQTTQQRLFHLEIFWVCTNPKAHTHKLKLKNREQEGLEDKKSKSKCPPDCPVHNSYILTRFHSPVQFSSPYRPAN